MDVKRLIKRVPLLGDVAQHVYFWASNQKFSSSQEYWSERYANGGNSGRGSYGRLAEFKAQVINNIVSSEGVRRVIEFGCGDGNQLALSKYPEYIGLDVAPGAIELCTRRFHDDQTKSFFLYNSSCFADNLGVFRSDLALSLDVIIHLVEDSVFDTYMSHLFRCGLRLVLIYSSNEDKQTSLAHVRDREFLAWITANCPEWQLTREIPNPFPFSKDDPENTSTAGFYLFTRQ
jgi:SAM-dependent methyltransferase